MRERKGSGKGAVGGRGEEYRVNSKEGEGGQHFIFLRPHVAFRTNLIRLLYCLAFLRYSFWSWMLSGPDSDPPDSEKKWPLNILFPSFLRFLVYFSQPNGVPLGTGRRPDENLIYCGPKEAE